MDGAAKRQPEIQTPEENHPALNALLGANPFVGLDATQVLGTLDDSADAYRVATRHRRLARAATDARARADRRRRLLGGSRSGRPALRRSRMDAASALPSPDADLPRVARRDARSRQRDESVEWKEVEQQKFALTLLTEALAPTNSFMLNPAALKRAFDTYGMSVLWGLRNFVGDLWNNGGMPSTVDKRPFEVGKNLALSPGAVVFRSPVCEVIQYAPATDKVYERPLLFIPPQINKFYIMDLAPGRSFVEYAVKHGIPMFTISWRNPTPRDRDWGLDEYVTACKDAIAAACEITGSPDCNVLGVCAGGITTVAHARASRGRRATSASTRSRCWSRCSIRACPR